MPQSTVYLMRGLPCCGKSFTARNLAGDEGIVLETDEFFYQCVGEDPTEYNYSREALVEARKWNFRRFVEAVQARLHPIVIDRGNNLSPESQRYAKYAVEHGYQVELKEPESQWWHEIRVLLKYRPTTNQILDQWASRLSESSRAGHRVPASLIRQGMDQWQLDLTVEGILSHRFGPAEAENPTDSARRICAEGR